MEITDDSITPERITGDKKNRILVYSSVIGVLGSIGISSLFFLSMYFFATFKDAILLIWDLKFWIFPLVLGFGLQIGLFSYMKFVLSHQKAMLSAKTSVSASGGMSAVSMAACCAHHLTDVLPFLGVTTLSVFLTEYKVFFLAVGISSNIIGIFLMLKNILEHGLFLENGFFSRIKNINMKLVFRSSIAVSIIFSLSVLLKIILYS